jgi:hypothetical protein
MDSELPPIVAEHSVSASRVLYIRYVNCGPFRHVPGWSAPAEQTSAGTRFLEFAWRKIAWASNVLADLNPRGGNAVHNYIYVISRRLI